MADTGKGLASSEAGIVMFSGKGGVGKTTCAAATALHYASQGERTLAISTDATPSLSHIFEAPGDGKPKMVRESLYVNELGTEEVEQMWDEKFGREVYDVFSSFVDIGYDEFVEFTTSILPGLSEEFMVDYIRELGLGGGYGRIVWDTAPIGQTLALLGMPAVILEHLRMAPKVYARLKHSNVSKEPILNIITRWQQLSADEMEFLRDGVRFVLVTIPEALAVEQLEGVFREMGRHGLKVSRLVVNNVITADGSDFLRARAAEQRKYLDRIHERYSDLGIVELPLFPHEVKGWDRLREVARILFP